ncbi:unnamed protein product [Ectocarpus fasciculatus]
MTPETKGETLMGTMHWTTTAITRSRTSWTGWTTIKDGRRLRGQPTAPS